MQVGTGSGSNAGDGFSAAVAEVYAADLDAFVATRDAAASALRAAGDRAAATALRRCRRPTLAAWALNQLVRARPELIADALDLGERLRAAQASLDAAALRGLRPAREALVSDLVHATETVAATRGRPLGGAATEEVRQSVIALLADPAAAQVVRSGRLERSLSYAGFGEVDLTAVVAHPPPTPRSRSEPSNPVEAARDARAEEARAAKAREAKSREAEAVQLLRAAEAEATAASLAQAQAQARLTDAARRTAELRALADQAQAEEDAAGRGAAQAARRREEAEAEVRRRTAQWQAARRAAEDATS